MQDKFWQDLFWKSFAVATLLIILGIFTMRAFTTRYTVQNAHYVLDKWTGKVWHIKDAMKKR